MPKLLLWVLSLGNSEDSLKSDVLGFRMCEDPELVVFTCCERDLAYVVDRHSCDNLPGSSDVSSKELMKKVFVENGIPTSKHVIMGVFDEEKVRELSYPIIVKPVDSYSSRGVRKVFNIEELKGLFESHHKYIDIHYPLTGRGVQLS